MTHLVVMAAGLGSRFGGDKQLVDVGPKGEAFLDYGIRGAVAAGVTDVVIIVRSEIEGALREHLAKHHGDEVNISFVCQDQHGPDRAKPWGTAHAVLTAAPVVDGSFLVVNADDYYGDDSYLEGFRALADAATDEAVIVAFQLDHTLPPAGSVSRGVCTADADGYLTSIVETHGIERAEDGIIRSDDPAGEHGGDTLVSMNMMAFPGWLMAELETGFEAFLAQHGDEIKTEFLLPDVVARLQAEGRMRVRVVETSEQWIGVTNPDDLEPARKALAQK